jgi:hypothetical protein
LRQRGDETHRGCDHFASGNGDSGHFRRGGLCGAGFRRRGRNNRSSLTDRQQQAQQEQATPIHQRYPRIANPQNVKRRRPRTHHERELNGERRDVAKPEMTSFLLLQHPGDISNLGVGELFVFDHCSSSGRADPLNARSMNSRIMARTTCCLGMSRGKYVPRATSRAEVVGVDGAESLHGSDQPLPRRSTNPYRMQELLALIPQ